MKDEKQSTDVREYILATAQPIVSVKGFSGVGLSEILKAADVPKGSFYHYFGSKEAFGQSLLERYFDAYMAALDEIFARSEMTAKQRLMAYCSNWLETQTADVPQSKCLVVKLAAEVSDLSEPMRYVLLHGTQKIMGRIADIITAGQEDGSLSAQVDPDALAHELYQTWLGASLLAKISRDDEPFLAAMASTDRLLS